MKKTLLALACLMTGLSIVAPAQAAIEPQAPASSTAAKADEPRTPEDYYWRAYEEEQAKDYSHAINDYVKAADDHYALAQYRLGRMYYKALGLSAPEYGLAFLYFQKAAAQGVTDAQTGLGILYQNGQGVTKDLSQALKWYNIAAEGGDDYAMYNIGNLYETGQGVAKDMDKAFGNYNWALLNANPVAAERLQTLSENSQDPEAYLYTPDKRLVEQMKAFGLLEKQWPLSFAKCRKITRTESGQKPSEAIVSECRNTFSYLTQITDYKNDIQSSFFRTELLNILKSYYIAPVLYQSYMDQGPLSSNAGLAASVSSDLDHINKAFKVYGLSDKPIEQSNNLYANARVYKIHFLPGDKERDISLTNLTQAQAISEFSHILASGLFELTLGDVSKYYDYDLCRSTTNVNLLLETHGILSGKVLLFRNINRSINPDTVKNFNSSLMDYSRQTCLPLLIVEGEPFVIDFSNGMPRLISWSTWYVQVMLNKRNAILECPYGGVNWPMKYIYITDQHGHIPTSDASTNKMEFYYPSYQDEEISQVNKYNLDLCGFKARKVKKDSTLSCPAKPFTTVNVLKPN